MSRRKSQPPREPRLARWLASVAPRRHNGGWMRFASVYGRLALTLAQTARATFGVARRACNICGRSGRFLAFGEPLRFDARCPGCGAMERHRLVALWIAQHRERLAQAVVLHFAPEHALSRLLRPLARQYITADIDPGRADVALDIEAIDRPDASVDVVVCNHVLEHVDDRRALSELRRVLRPGGLALLTFPIVEGWERTYEDDGCRDPAERRRRFGQSDHVRYYGRDVRDRIRQAGFALEEFTAEEPHVDAYALLRGEKIFLAMRPA